MTKIKTTTQRRLAISKEMYSNESVDVNELSQKLGVSEVTIRKDLKYLELKGQLLRTRGGAIKPMKVGLDIAIEERKKRNYLQKVAIGKAAAKIIQNGDTLILDSGTTVMQLAQNLGSFKDLTVITNALDIASKLVDFDRMQVIIPGGLLRKKSLSLVGVMAAENFRNIKSDLFFFSADGFSITDGFTTPNIEEAHLCRMVMKNSKRNIVLIDSSKFNQSALIKITGIDKVHTIITDDISPGNLTKLENAGIEVIIAETIK